MNRFLKLINFEVSRFLFMFAILLAMIVSMQIIASIITAMNIVDRIEGIMKTQQLTYEQYAQQSGKIDINYILGTIGFIGPLMFGMTVLVLYVFFIWYRDWFGKATFSYRLMMLPTKRIHIYFAKLVAILLFVFAALAIELGVITILFAILENVIPAEVYTKLSFREIGMNDLLALILPYSFGIFSFNYLLGIAAVMVVFTCILFERSLRLKGIVFAIIYAILCITIALAPVIYQNITHMLFLTEMYFVESIVAIVICTLSIATSNYLLKNKMNV